jgi:XTP/dITP diphosphohydrolase
VTPVGFPPRLALATRNPHKVREVLEVCEDWPVRWVTLESAPIPDVEETGSTYLDNARLKARATAHLLDIPALADDSGIEVGALAGDPGPRSARFAGASASDAENLELLIRRIGDRPPDERVARYRCVVVLEWPESREVSAEGVCEGMLILEPRGALGFGYDPIFVPRGWSRTMAELSPAEKNAISHRGRALRALARILRHAGSVGSKA